MFIAKVTICKKDLYSGYLLGQLDMLNKIIKRLIDSELLRDDFKSVLRPETIHDASDMAKNEVITSYYPGLSPKEVAVLREVIETARDFHGHADYDEVVARILDSNLSWEGNEFKVYDIIDRLARKKILQIKLHSANTFLLDFEENFWKAWDARIEYSEYRYFRLYDNWVNNPKSIQKQKSTQKEESD